MPRKVLIAMDGSAHAETAFQFYLEDLHQEGNDVILAYVTEHLHQGFLSSSKEQFEQKLQALQKKADDINQKYSDMLKEKNITCKFVQESGEPGHHIIHMAETEGAQLIVLGSRGLGTLRRTILGSISDYVLHHAHIPVAICKH